MVLQIRSKGLLLVVSSLLPLWWVLLYGISGFIHDLQMQTFTLELHLHLQLLK
jgi:hypothetical protein